MNSSADDAVGSWDRRHFACIERGARKASDAGETPAVPGKKILKLFTTFGIGLIDYAANG